MSASGERARWRRLDALLEQALDLPAAQRAAFLDDACGGDAGLRRELEELLAADARPGGALDAPPPWRENPVGALDAPPLWREGADGAPDVPPPWRKDPAGALDAPASRRGAAGEGLAGADEPGETGETDESGALVGAYRLVRRLGQGGMGAVYLAERADGQFAQRVALKLVRGSFLSADAERRFRRERSILATLEHPHIARLYDGGVSGDGRPYFVMEHVEGEDLLAFCDRRRLPVRARLALFRDVCAAVSFAHASLVVHRDLKPGNVLVTGGGAVKLLDFGLAKLLDPDRGGDAPDATRAGAQFLTPDYASPEQWRGEPVTTATDVYSLGVMLYELLTGRRPRAAAAGGLDAAARGALDVEPTRPSGALGRDAESAAARLAAARGSTPARLRRTLAGDLDNIVLKALRLDPQRRYPSAEALAEDLARHLAGQPVGARPDTLGYRTRKFLLRHRAAVVATAAVALLVGLLVAFYTARLARERDRARHAASKAEQVASFLTSLFALSDPERARGRDLTAREILDRGARQVEGSLAGQPELQAEMLTLIGQVYYRLGMLSEARRILEGAVEKSRAAHAEESPALGETLRELGMALEDTGALDAASRRLGEAEAIFRRHGDRVGLARVLTDQGNLQKWRGDYAAARRRIEEGATIAATLGGEYEYLLARQLNDLGLVLWRLDELAAARRALERSLALHERHAGSESPLVAGTLANLAMVLAESGEPAAARPLAERSLALRRRVFGERHFQVASALSTLGTVAWRSEDGGAARRLYTQSIDLYAATLGSDSPDLAWPLRHRCRLLVEQREPSAAVGDCRRALAIRESAFGTDHPDTAASVVDLAGARLAAGADAGADAEASCRRALDVLRQRLPPAHPRVVEAERLLAAVRAARRR